MPKQVTSFPHGNHQQKTSVTAGSDRGIAQDIRNDKMIARSKRTLQTPLLYIRAFDLPADRTCGRNYT
jgi:hypothetical protein